ncbi:MAG: hypothetical protein HC905_27455, partial [Bacteroidales bacterium]|nr:hypothetical protein [Bacteroidales bacterium]
LADDASGKFTDFEEDKEKVAGILKERGIWSVEFITTRNSQEVLEEYAGYFYHQGFVVSFGTEHNTPAMEPVLLHSRGGNLLSDLLIDINYKGACVIAAHQYLYATEGEGYLDSSGTPNTLSRSSFEELGNALIHHIIR